MHRIVSVKAKIEADKKDERVLHLKIDSLQNDDVKPQYRVSVKCVGDENYAIAQDWTMDSEVDLLLEDGATEISIKVEAGSSGDACGVAYQEYVYGNKGV